MSMSLIYDQGRYDKIHSIFLKHCQGKKNLPNNKIHKFWEEMGVATDLFLSDFYYYFPQIEKGGDLAFQDCLAFLDYILTPKNSKEEILQIFKMFDRNGIGHISTAQLLLNLRKELPQSEYQRYCNIISSYGPSINYIELFEKKKGHH